MSVPVPPTPESNDSTVRDHQERDGLREHRRRVRCHSEQFLDDITRWCQAEPGQVGGPDPEPGEDRGAEVGGGDRAVDGLLAAAVGGADDVPALDASAGEQGRVARVPVVAARAVVDLGRPAELAHGNDQGRLQQATVVKVVEQGRERPVEHPAVAVLHDLEVAVVHVPAAVARVLGALDVRAPVDLDEGDSRLDQPAGDQAALAEAVRPIRRRGLRTGSRPTSSAARLWREASKVCARS